MNPMVLMKLKTELAALGERHPKFSRFALYLAEQELPEDTVLDVSVKTPAGKTIHGNMKLDAADLKLIKLLKELKD